MALTCPADVDLMRLRNAVHLIYARIALDPTSAFPFHRGVDYAVRSLGYDATALESVPADVTSCFMGVGNPHAIGPVHAKEVVVDLGCGSGTDLLLAARRVGLGGRAIGLDTNESMRDRAERGARRAGFGNVEIRYGDIMDLPLPAASVDVIQSNSVLFQIPQKDRAIAEMTRVLRPGGRLHLADVVVEDLPEHIRHDVGLWADCIAGALAPDELIGALKEAGFRRVRITARFDCFAGTPKEKLAQQYGAYGANIFAVRR